MESIEREQSISLTAENIGGIEYTDVEFEPGVTVLAGRNATHRTSFLQVIMAALGSERASLKGDTDEGYVRLELGDDAYTRELHRQGDTVTFSGDPYLADPELADLFAFLLESNEARRTVALRGDLREIIMKPIDADAIQSDIEDLEDEKRDIEDRIEELESLDSELPILEEKRTQLEADIEDTRERLESKREELEARSTDASDAKEERSELDAKMAELQRKKSDLERTEFQLESQQDSLATLEDEHESLEEARVELEDGDDVDTDAIRSDVQRLRERKQALSTELNKLQNVIQFNEEMLEGASQDIAAALRDDQTSDGDVTDQLLDADESVVCWTCGTDVERDSIEGTLDRLRSLRQSKYSERSDVESDVEELKQRLDEAESKRRERERIEEELADVRAEIDERTAKLDDLRADHEDLSDDIETLEDEIETLEEEDRSEVLEAHREVNELEVELDRLEADRDSVTEDIEDIESKLGQVDELEAEKERVHEELTDRRTRIEQIEDQAIGEFNDHMSTVLDILDYTNIDRIWVERTEREVREGRRKVTKSEFDLHVVRSTDGGVTYEDDFEHLSESEREVTGLVFALAGYLVHDVYENVPFMLLDSLEAIDSARIAKLVDYFGEYADNLVVALLNEDADALDDSYEYIREI